MGEEADRAAGAVLSRAFFDDPVFVWALPDEAGRQKLGAFFTGLVRWGRRFGAVEHLGPDAAPTAVAIWGSRAASALEHVRAGLLGPTLALGPGAVLRLMQLGAKLEGHHRRLCPQPHRYLYFLGVDPPHQRKGLGAELIRPGLGEADRAGQPCYLETTREANVAFYRRLDFSVVHEGSVHPPAPRFWLLKRAPRSI